MDAPLRVLLVDDAVTYRKLVSDLLAQMPGIEVVGTAANGRIALGKCDQLHPDLLVLDLEMPELDGLGLLRRLRESGKDVGAIVLSSPNTMDAKATMAALELGAFDFVAKPNGGSLEENRRRLASELGARLQAFARTHQVRRLLRQPASCRSAASSPAPSCAESPVRACAAALADMARARPEVVALGISTGGPKALSQMLPKLPKGLPVPVLLVQHMPPVFTRSLAEDLDARCELRVCEAADGQPVRPGCVYIAPGGQQMMVERREGGVAVRITSDPPENSCRPSVDYLFRSVAEVWGGRAVGVIMTGMGSDGAKGCRLLKQRGAAIVAQDQATCVVFGMPREIVEGGVADVVAPLDRIAAEITALVGRR